MSFNVFGFRDKMPFPEMLMRLAAFSLPSITALVLFVAALHWNGALYFVGGDNSQLYYLMPKAMTSNYLFNVVADNSLGGLGNFCQQLYQAPFFYALAVLHGILPEGINIQGVSLGLNLAFSFLGFYWLLGLWLDKDEFDVKLVRVIASVIYATSLLVVSTLWRQALYAVYLTSLYPLVLFLFLKGVRARSFRFVASAALLATVFSIVLMAVPWLMAVLLVTTPILIWHQARYPNTIYYLCCFGILLIGMNIFWLWPMIYSLLSPDNAYSVLSSPWVNDYLIKEVTRSNNIAYPLLGSSMPRWIEGVDKMWLGSLPTTVVFSSLILLAGMLGHKSRKLTHIFLASFAGWILAVYFYTVHIGAWGCKAFIYFNHVIPGFTMFRNNFDKFGLAIAFIYAFLAAISLAVLIDTPVCVRYRKSCTSFLLVLFVLAVAQALPLLRGNIYGKPLWTTQNTYNTISRFNADFTNMISFLKQQPGDAKFLWLPLNTAGYVNIADAELPNHYYSGPSPLRFLADKSDYTGRFSFGTQSIGDKLINDILAGNLEDVAYLLKVMNVGYIIVNNDISRDLRASYLYTVFGKGDLYDAQFKFLKPFAAGKHLADFGKRYSIYAVKPEIFLNKIHLSSNGAGRAKVAWSKVSSSKYSLRLENVSPGQELIFLEPFHEGWSLITKNGLKLPSGLARHSHGLGYANAWRLDFVDFPKSLASGYFVYNKDATVSMELQLEFLPANLVSSGLWVSVLTALCSLCYLLFGLAHNLTGNAHLS